MVVPRHPTRSWFERVLALCAGQDDRNQEGRPSTTSGRTLAAFTLIGWPSGLLAIRRAEANGRGNCGWQRRGGAARTVKRRHEQPYAKADYAGGEQQLRCGHDHRDGRGPRQRLRQQLQHHPLRRAENRGGCVRYSLVRAMPGGTRSVA